MTSEVSELSAVFSIEYVPTKRIFWKTKELVNFGNWLEKQDIFNC